MVRGVRSDDWKGASTAKIHDKSKEAVVLNGKSSTCLNFYGSNFGFHNMAGTSFILLLLGKYTNNRSEHG